MSQRVFETIKIRILFTWGGAGATGLNSTFTINARNPAGSTISGGSVSSAELADGYYDVTIAAAAVLTPGNYSVSVSSSSFPLDNAGWAYGKTEVDSVPSTLLGFLTVASGSTTTSITTSSCSPPGGVADQFKGRTLTFRSDTTTAALRGVQAVEILASSNSSTPTFSVSALPTAPASGDVAVIA